MKTQYNGFRPHFVVAANEMVCRPHETSNFAIVNMKFYFLTSTRRDFEHGLPKALEQLLADIRDAFLDANWCPNSETQRLLAVTI